MHIDLAPSELESSNFQWLLYLSRILFVHLFVSGQMFKLGDATISQTSSHETLSPKLWSTEIIKQEGIQHKLKDLSYYLNYDLWYSSKEILL